MFRFETLDIWKDSRVYCNDIYMLTKSWPKSELFGLTSQIRRAAISISSNIAEGSASNSKKDFRNFLNISKKSLYETVSQLILAYDQELITKNQEEGLYKRADILARKISAFQKILR